ncbi:hypothetical protein DUNSADRAFT_3701, partial [Dunaliella salina]
MAHAQDDICISPLTNPHAARTHAPHSAECACPACAQVHVTTTPVTPDMLRGGFPGGLALPAGHTMMLTMPADVALAGLGGLFPGMEGGPFGTENFDQILTNILNQYQPAAQPAARSVVERLPRRRVRGGQQQAPQLSQLPHHQHHDHQQQQQQQQQQQEGGKDEVHMRVEGAKSSVGHEKDEMEWEQACPHGGVGDAAGAAGTNGTAIPGKAAEKGLEACEEKPATGPAHTLQQHGQKTQDETAAATGQGQAREEATAGEPREGLAKEAEEWARCQEGEPCSVCLSLFGAGEVAVELPCGHDFHEGCILPWLQDHHTCPTCRGPLPLEDETRPSVSAADIRDAAHRNAAHIQRQNSAEATYAQPPQPASHTQPQGREAAGAGREAGLTHYPELAQAQHNLAQRLHSIRTRVRALRRRQTGESSRGTQTRELEEQQQRRQDAQDGPSWVSVQAMEEEIRQLEEEELRPLEEDVQQEQQHILQEHRALQEGMHRDLERRERDRQQQRQQQQGDRNR